MIFNSKLTKTFLLPLAKKVPFFGGIARRMEEHFRLRAELSRVTAQRDRFQTAFAPGHFYSPVPDLRELQLRDPGVFDRFPESIPGVDLNSPGQQELLHTLSEFYSDVPFDRQKQKSLRYYYANPNFPYCDAIILHSMIRLLRPRRIIEIGCGFSSGVMLDTNERFFSNAIQCVFIDPFPQTLQSLLKPQDGSQMEIIQECVQDVPLNLYSELKENDILFVDSSHVLKTGGDLNHILFEVLPRLHAGVYVHFHDVAFPFEYPKYWVFGGRAWNECYALRAFLQYNRAFQIVCFNSYLVRTQRAFLQQKMPLCLEGDCGSLWLRKTTGEEIITDAPPQRTRDFKPSHKIDVVNLDHPRQLGRGWFESDHDLAGRWAGALAEVVLRGPERPGQKIVLRGLQPNPRGTNLTLSADGDSFAKLALPPGPFVVTQVLPDNLVNRERLILGLQVDNAYRPPDDERELGVYFGTIEVV
jgi:Methyltransferase domain